MNDEMCQMRAEEREGAEWPNIIINIAGLSADAFRSRKILWCLAALMLLAYPFWEATTLTVEEHTLYVTDLPANLKNLKIVFASDIHQCAWFSQSRVNELIGTINGLNADIIILGGDYATDSDSAIAFFRTAPALHTQRSL